MGLFEFGRQLAVQADAEKVLKLAAQGVCRLCDAKATAIWTLSEEEPGIAMRAWHPVTPTRTPPSWGLTRLRRVAKEGKPVCFSSQQLARSSLHKDLGKVAAALFPLRCEEKVWGIMGVACGEGKPFSAEDMKWLGLVADQVETGLRSVEMDSRQQRLKEQSLAQLENLSETAERMLSCPDFSALIGTTAKATSEALHCPIAGVALKESSGHLSVVPHGCVGIGRGRGRGFQFLPPRGSIIDRVLSSGDTLAFHGVCKKPECLAAMLSAKSVACAPLLGAEGPLGILFVAHPEQHEFRARELALLSAHAGQAAIALRNALLGDDFTRHLDRLAAFAEYARTLAASLDLDQTLKTVLDSAISLLETDFACVILREREGKNLELRAAHGFTKKSAFCEAISAPGPGEGLVGLALEQDKVIVSRDLARDGRCKIRDYAREKGPASAMVAPLKAGGKSLGVLCVFTKQPRDFAEQDKRLVSMLTDGAGIAIENARLYQEEKKRSTYLSNLIHEANHRIRNSLQVVAGLLEMEAAHDYHSREEALRKSIDRIHCIGAVHGLLSRRDLQQVEMKESARRIAKIVSQSVGKSDGVDVAVSGARVMLESQKATSLSLVIHELVDNALRHGIGSRQQGKAQISFTRSGRELMVMISDDGVGLAKDFDLNRHSGMGLKTVVGLVTQDLGGEFRLFSKNEGAIAQIRLPRQDRPSPRAEKDG